MFKNSKIILIVSSFAVLHFLLQFSQIFREYEHIVTRVTVDDTYYYLKIALNFHRFDFTTFDGIHECNGIQLAWFWMLALLANFFKSYDPFLRAALTLAVILNLSCYIPIIKIGKILGRNSLLICSAFGWFYLNARYNFYISGMENSLHAVVLWNLLWALMLFFLKAKSGQGVGLTLIWCTLLMILSVWTRIDSIMIIIPCCLFILHILWRNSLIVKNGSILIVCSLITAVGAFLMLQTFNYMAGMYLPISGLIKQQQYNWSVATLTELLIRAFQFTNPLLALAEIDSPRRTLASFSAFLLLYLLSKSIIALGLRSESILLQIAFGIVMEVMPGLPSTTLFSEV